MKKIPLIILKNFENQLKKTVKSKNNLIVKDSSLLASFEYKKLEVIEKWLRLKIELFESLISRERISFP